MSLYKLRCFIAGGCSYFSIRIDPSEELGHLKWLIYDSQKNGLLGVPEGGLMLFQVDVDLESVNQGSLRHHNFATTHELNHRPDQPLSSVWPVQPPINHVHVFVQLTTPRQLARRFHQVGKCLHQLTWGRDFEEMLLDVPDCGGLRYIPEIQVNKLGLRHLGYGENVLLESHEYISAFDNLTSMSSNETTGGVIVTGQPGIGKSCFLFYVLLRRLCECRPTALDLDDMFLLFDNTGVQLHDAGPAGNFALEKRVWALTDSSANKQPNRAFYQAGQIRNAWVVKATLPERKQWHQWHKELIMHHFVMNCFTWDHHTRSQCRGSLTEFQQIGS